jgi:hypothetical protein
MEALHALLALVASVQVRVPALPGSPACWSQGRDEHVLPGGMTLLRTPAVEMLVASKSRLSELLEQRRYDKVAAVRHVAAAAALEVAALPDPPDQGQPHQQDQGAAPCSPAEGRDVALHVKGAQAVPVACRSQQYQRQERHHAGQALVVAANLPGTAVIPAGPNVRGKGLRWQQHEQASRPYNQAACRQGMHARRGSCWGVCWQPTLHNPGDHPASIR